MIIITIIIVKLNRVLHPIMPFPFLMAAWAIFALNGTLCHWDWALHRGTPQSSTLDLGIAIFLVCRQMWHWILDFRNRVRTARSLQWCMPWGVLGLSGTWEVSEWSLGCPELVGRAIAESSQRLYSAADRNQLPHQVSLGWDFTEQKGNHDGCWDVKAIAVLMSSWKLL